MHEQKLKIVEQPKPMFATINRIAKKGLSSLAPRSYLIERLGIERGDLISICGKGNSAKTIFAQYLMLCVEQGRSLFGRFEVSTSKKLNVLHIDQEQTETQTQRRYERLANGIGIDSMRICRTKLTVMLDDPSISSSEVERQLIDMCSGFDLVCIDSLRRVMGCDENSSQGVSAVLGLLKQVAEKCNCVIIVIHHMGKGESGAKQSARGSSAIYGCVDVQIDLALEDSATGLISIRCAKMRDAVYWSGMQFRLRDAGDYHAEQRCSEQLMLDLIEADVLPAETNSQKRILDIIKSGLAKETSINRSVIYAQAGISKAKLDELLASMRQQSLIVETKGEKNARLFSLGENANSYMEWVK